MSTPLSTFFLAFLISSLGSNNIMVVQGLSSVATNLQREAVVLKYFDGVNKKDRKQIRSCFASSARIRDVCGLNSSERDVNPDDLADR